MLADQTKNEDSNPTIPEPESKGVTASGSSD